jgi:hypothetical protein
LISDPGDKDRLDAGKTIDEPVENPKTVTPAKAGVQNHLITLDSVSSTE